MQAPPPRADILWEVTSGDRQVRAVPWAPFYSKNYGHFWVMPFLGTYDKFWACRQGASL